MPTRLIVLDRDGVINRESSSFIRSPEEWIPLPDSLRAIAELTTAGFAVVVATNQSGVGRGLFTARMLSDIHARMTSAIEAAGGRLAGIFFCPHRPEDGCECRKPRPGLMRQIEAHFGMSLHGQPVIGDSHRDLEAAWQVGARAILVRTGNGAATEGRLDADMPVTVFPDLATAASALIAEKPAA
ncbi:MAG: D-glycero-beta-D-manno-heptose 1,7-bisphosphate 7-phosphatase [Gammaproteobacteria bacterium]|nr:D-glycero-beta-D-manno-heptose 1,7-bisphosphate 7-phosphatase [Gammaproteobacteria bacterium]